MRFLFLGRANEAKRHVAQITQEAQLSSVLFFFWYRHVSATWNPGPTQFFFL